MSRVGLNVLWLVPGVVGGSEEYTTRLLNALSDDPPTGIDFTLFGNRLLAPAYPDLVERFDFVEAPVTGTSKGLRVAAENTWLAIESRRRGLDVLHHLGGIMPFVRGCPGMLTIHDLQPLVMPEHFQSAKRWFARVSIPPSARHARVIVTLTEATSRMLVDRLGVDPTRIEVLPAGVRLPSDDELAAERALEVRELYDLGTSRLVLYPAITYPHKNHAFLIEAFAPLAAARPDVVLVLTGGSAQTESEVRASIARHRISSQVRRLGRIPRSHLDALYQEAAVLVFPSRFEGFGIPILEAMSRGCPVVAADATALPEVVGDAGVLLPLDDVTRWTSELMALIDDEERRSALVAAGRRRAATFDWPSVARRLGELYSRTVQVS